jgi:hypothetical protein
MSHDAQWERLLETNAHWELTEIVRFQTFWIWIYLGCKLFYHTKCVQKTIVYFTFFEGKVRIFINQFCVYIWGLKKRHVMSTQPAMLVARWSAVHQSSSICRIRPGETDLLHMEWSREIHHLHLKRSGEIDLLHSKQFREMDFFFG